MHIGDLRVEPIFDGVLKAPATANKGTTDGQWAPHRRFLDPEGRLEFALGGFLVRAPADRLILIDAGVGPQPVPSWLVRQRSRAESC